MQTVLNNPAFPWSAKKILLEVAEAATFIVIRSFSLDLA
jgi:hypothetical protein